MSSLKQRYHEIHEEDDILLEKNQHKIDWNSLSFNSEIFDYSYEYLEERCNIYKEELIQKAMSPKKLQRYIDDGYNVEEILEFL